MRIGQVAEQVGVDPPTIRFYEAGGLLPEPARTPAGYRDYRETDVDRLRFISTARSLDLALDDIGEILALRDRGEAPCRYVRQLLNDHAGTIRTRIAELEALQADLEVLRRRAAAFGDTGSTDCVCHIIEGEPTGAT